MDETPRRPRRPLEQPTGEWHDEREQRLAALRRLADGSQRLPPLPAPGTLRPPAKRRLRLLQFGVPAALLGLAVVVIVAHTLSSARPGSKKTSALPLAAFITPQKDGMVCAIDVAWSPHGDRIAVLGYTQSCPRLKDTVAEDHSVTVASIYDATTLKLLDQIHPDDAIHQSVPQSANASALTIVYEGVLWSPDGTSLAFPFIQQQGQFSENTTVGLVTTSLIHRQTRVYDGVQVSASDTLGSLAAIWDLTQARSALRLIQIPPAFAYAWQPGGALVPVGARLTYGSPAVTTPRQPIGVPSDSSFGMWQPGDAMLAAPDASSGSTQLVHEYDSSFSAWSPDGRYIIAPLNSFITVAQSGQQAPSGEISTAARDVALSAVYQALQARWATGEVSAGEVSAPIAWRPDGKVLAAWVSAPQSSGSGQAVTIFDSASGKTLATLQPVSEPQFELAFGRFGGPINAMRWSPDGKHLLLFAPSLGTITIWNPGQLPR